MHVVGGFKPRVMRRRCPGTGPVVANQIEPSTGLTTAPYPFTGIRLSTAGSIFPSPLVSRYAGHQPCAFFASPVSSKTRVFNQPKACPPGGLKNSVLSLSKPNWRWWVLKQVSMGVNFFVSGSYTAACLPALFTGKYFANGLSDPALQKSGLSDGRTFDVTQTLPFSSIIGLCGPPTPVHRTSFPYTGEGTEIFFGQVGVMLERSAIVGTRIAPAVFLIGSTHNRSSSLKSAAYTRPLAFTVG